jgi:hypothetical protein
MRLGTGVSLCSPALLSFSASAIVPISFYEVLRMVFSRLPATREFLMMWPAQSDDEA